MRRILTTSIFSIAMLVSAPSWAQPADATPSNEPSAETLRAAGNAARFRVIKRFPTPTQALVGKTQWPFPDDVRIAVEEDRWDDAWKLLESASDPKDETFVFMRGYVALQAGAFDKAEEALSRVGANGHVLADYAHLYAAEAAAGQKAWDRAAALAARVSKGSLPHPDATYLVARALWEAGNGEQAARALRAFVDVYANAPEAPEAQLLLARARKEAKQHAEAAELLVDLRHRYPLWSKLDEAAELEAEVLKKLPKSARTRVLAVEPKDIVVKYDALFGAHRSQEVIDGLAKPVLKWRPKTAERCTALYMVANSYTKLRKHADSVPWYGRIVGECKGKPEYLRALYKGGKGYWNAGQKDDARRYFQKIWTEFPQHSYADDAMYFAARILTEQDKLADAEKLMTRQVAAYPDGDMASDAHWLRLRDDFAKGEFQRVVDYVDGLKDTGEKDLYSRGRLAYFRARALQQLGKKQEAEAAYARVVADFPMSYYGLLAFNRLADTADGGNGKTRDAARVKGGALLQPLTQSAGSTPFIPEALRADGAFLRGQAFLTISFSEHAAREFRELRGRLADEPEQLWALSALLDAAEAYPYSHDIPRRNIDDWEEEYPARENPRWRIGYPRPFGEEVSTWAKKRELPEAIVRAIMREESGFNPRIRSWAGAIGLMQLMPGTAKIAAKQDDFTDFSLSNLTEPAVAVRVGTAYLDDLAERGKQHPILIIAGYNGGWGNVSKWLDKTETKDIDLWVEDIPYGQTRDYTKRVLRSFWVYSWLYGEDRVPRFSMTL